MSKKRPYKKSRSSEDIRFKDEYYKWRKAVLRRDKYKCQMPNCPGRCGKLQIHHIMTWASAAGSRFDVNNGITLGWKCHRSISGQERIWSALFMSIVEKNNSK